tara:strand:+ start:351 stop:1382 length:1032 start_codon:yes stop_codon:yes gene_type:complete
MVTVALDAMGGDFAPEPVVQATCALSLRSNSPYFLLVGDEHVLTPMLDRHPHDSEKIAMVHASQSIAMDESPKNAIRDKKDASIVVAARLVAEGNADVLVSAGNTGAVILACAKHFKRIKGVGRCALGSVFPTEIRRGQKEDPFSLILDAGLSVEVTGDDLVSFAVLGSAYAHLISKNEKPTVALLSNGSESNKGTQAIKAAHAQLKDMPNINFIGNIEGMDIPLGKADVVITDGFTGNVVLKMLEGVGLTMQHLTKYAYGESFLFKAGLYFLKPALKQLRNITDWRQYGGAPILGFDRLCIKAHGRSQKRAMENAIKLATKAARGNLVAQIEKELQATQGTG